MAQALPSFSGAAVACNVQVPAKDAGVQAASNGTKIVEHKDPISPIKPSSTINDKIPSLLSVIIDGLPPLQMSKYVNEAEKRLHQYVERYPNVTSLVSYCRVGLSYGSYVHPRVINVDRLVVVSFNYAILFLLDDLFFDSPDANLQDQYGISHDVCGSPEKSQEYLDHLDAIFKQQVQPSNLPPLIETMMSELGRETLKLSNPDWFNHYVSCVKEWHHTSVDSQIDIIQGRDSWTQDLDSYIDMRIENAGGRFVQMLVEIASNTYIPSAWRANPYMKNLTMTTCIHIGFTNDLFSYHKESKLEQNPRNLITVLTKCEGKPFAETVQMAIDLTNTYACAIVDLEAETWNSTLQSHLQDVIAVIAGNIYFCIMDDRYRHPESMFPELRNMTSSWKMHADAVV